MSFREEYERKNKKNVPQEKSVLGFISNVPGSVGGAIQDLAYPFLHPAETIEGMSSLGKGFLQGAVTSNLEKRGEKLTTPEDFGEKDYRRYPQALNDFFAKRWGTGQDIADNLYEDPAGMVLDLSSLLAPLAIGPKVASTAAKVASVVPTKKAPLLEKFANMGRERGFDIDPIRQTMSVIKNSFGFGPERANGVMGALSRNPLAKGIRNARTSFGDFLYSKPLRVFGTSPENVKLALPHLKKFIDGSPYTKKAFTQMTKDIIPGLAGIRDAEIAKTGLPSRRIGELFKEGVDAGMRDTSTDLHAYYNNPASRKDVETQRASALRSVNDAFHDSSTDTVEPIYSDEKIIFTKDGDAELGREITGFRGIRKLSPENTIPISQSEAGKMASNMQRVLGKNFYEKTGVGAISKEMEGNAAKSFRDYSLEGISEEGKKAHEALIGLSRVRPDLKLMLADPKDLPNLIEGASNAFLLGAGGTVGKMIAARNASRGSWFNKNLFPEIGKFLSTMGENPYPGDVANALSVLPYVNLYHRPVENSGTRHREDILRLMRNKRNGY